MKIILNETRCNLPDGTIGTIILKDEILEDSYVIRNSEDWECWHLSSEYINNHIVKKSASTKLIQPIKPVDMELLYV